MSINTKMTAIANEIRTLSGTTGKMGLDAMATNVNEANAEISEQENLIGQIVAALENKAAGGGSANIETCTVTVDIGAPISGNIVCKYVDNNLTVKTAEINRLGGSFSVCKGTILTLDSWSSMCYVSGECSVIFGSHLGAAFIATGNCTLTYSV